MAELTPTEQLEELRRESVSLGERIAEIIRNLDIPSLDNRIKELETELESPEVWSDPQRAGKLNQELTRLRERRDKWRELEKAASDAREFAELALGEDDPSQYLGDAKAAYKNALDEVNREETKLLLSEPEDSGDAICSIQSGAGGTDAQDWASMLLRMYLRYCERMGFSATVLDEHPGEQAGIKSATFEVSGEYAYGYLKCEEGIHRLVRISPFGQKRRETSFASLDVTPVIEEEEIEIDENDLRIDTYRSSGAGGQHVNKTDSAVRITHIPTGTVVSCQNERSQHKNKATALKILKSRLIEIERDKQAKELESERGSKHKIQFGGGHIRNYFLHPRKQIKDVRTGHETGNAERVLDGDIQDFIEVYLRARVSESTKGKS
ncbi:MAG TPA: peptide chain release factor 2 [Firmicutes bacterium]|nr:peptide chain release factor 2 [Bacillota bacterium]